MLTYLSKKISFFLFCKKIITCDVIEIYRYGFETILSTILGFLITIVIGCVLNMTLISILYYAVFVLLRQLTGGYHANTYFKCNFTFGVISFIIMGTTQLSVNLKQDSSIIYFVLIIFSIIIIWLYSPIENKYKPLDEKQKKRNHRLSFIFSLLLSFTSWFVYKYNSRISVMIILTLCFISMLILISILWEGGKESEKA